MIKRFSIRKESFGATIYDKERVNICYVNTDNYNSIISGNQIHTIFGRISKDNCKIIKSKATNSTILSAPEKIFIELTKMCNLRCKHCFNESGKSVMNEWSWLELKRLLKDASDMGIFKIRFTGGEPILSKHLSSALEYCQR